MARARVLPLWSNCLLKALKECMENDYFICPVCGQEVQTREKTCPSCGADDETGWSGNAAYPEEFDADDYNDAVQREFDEGKRPFSARNIVVAGIAIVLVVAFLRAYFF